MRRPRRALVLGGSAVGVWLGLGVLEARLTLAGERGLAAAASGLGVVAAIVLLVLLLGLAGRLLRWLAQVGPWRPFDGPALAPGSSPHPEAGAPRAAPPPTAPARAGPGAPIRLRPAPESSEAAEPPAGPAP
jgi:hypothetical protein